MSRGKYFNLDEARESKDFERFCKEHPSQGEAEAFASLLEAMAHGKPPKKQPEGQET